MTQPRLTLAALNALSEEAFTEHLGGIFEHSPWIARRAWTERPFGSRKALHAAMCAVLAAADETAALALLRAHPELAAPGRLTAASRSEQAGAGLDHLAEEQAADFARLNAEYRARFGFPFIIAVRGQRDAQAIAAALRARLGQTVAAEYATALAEVTKIAKFRLEDRIDG